MRNSYIVTYDIRDPKRLRKVFKTMKDFGEHLQYSVFECQFTKSELVHCQAELAEIINHNIDQVLFVDIGPTSGRGERVISSMGQAYAPIDAPCHIA
jgi:CRISPR-associated protein Cas2